MTTDTLKRFFICASICGSVSACATVQDARLARPIDEHGNITTHEVTRSGLRISGEERPELASRQFGVVELTFENPTSAWRRIRRVTLDFGSEAENRVVRVPWGEDIRAWYDATAQRNQIIAANEATALRVVALTGMTIFAASKSRSTRAAGGFATLGALAAMQSNLVSATVNSAEHVRIFPDSHLLAGAFAIPPKLFTKKWLLINTLGGANLPCVDRLVLTYEFEDHSREAVYLRYKTPSEWQAAFCSLG